MVSAANYIARRYGIHCAMPAAARRLCPYAIFLPSRISYYAEVSRQIREIYERFPVRVEPLSLGVLADSPACLTIIIDFGGNPSLILSRAMLA